MTATLTFQFNSDLTSDLDVWIKLQQASLPESAITNLYDVYQMILRAKTSLTAYSYTPVNLPFTISADGNTVRIPLSFYVFPSSLSLPYTLTNSIGTISTGVLESISKEQSLVCPMLNKYTFDYLIDISSLEWETPCYNALGEVISAPSYTVENNEVLFSETVFGIFRVKFLIKGYKHTATLNFTKSTTETHKIAGIIWNQRKYNSITNSECVVVCTFVDEGEEKQEILELKLPEFMEDFLKECKPGGLMVRNNWDDGIIEQVDIYYSTCTGNILTTNRYDIAAPEEE
jgi:hypothetical protein